MLPFSYATQHLLRDVPRLLQKIFGSCVVVFLVFAAGAFNDGMDAVLSSSGSPHNVILLSAGSEEGVERSEIDLQVETLAAAGIKGIAQPLGNAAVSGEVHFMGEVTTADQTTTAQGLLRGVTPIAVEVHQNVRVLAGQFPGSGQVMVGRLAHHVLGVAAQSMQVGKHIYFENEQLEIAGIFEAPGTVLESEIWFYRNDLMTLIQRDALSCAIVRLTDPAAFAMVDMFAKQRLDLELSAVRESTYYAKLSSFYQPIRSMTWVTACLIAAGAIFGGFNMLYAAFASRVRELATLQAIGFSRTAIFISIVQESLLATLTGFLLAAFLAITLLEGVSVSFSMGTFTLTLNAKITVAALITGVLLGFMGAIPPAIRCLGAPLPRALRS